jgi:L-aminopeptidase/D-esterase-like protein
LATGNGAEIDTATLTRLGSLAADCLARAVMRAVVAAEPLGGYPSWRGMYTSS